MEKNRELSDPNSCWNKAEPGEIVFVLLERDISTPATIRDWCRRRIMHGKNVEEDPQIQEALECAKRIERKQNGRRPK